MDHRLDFSNVMVVIFFCDGFNFFETAALQLKMWEIKMRWIHRACRGRLGSPSENIGTEFLHRGVISLNTLKLYQMAYSKCTSRTWFTPMCFANSTPFRLFCVRAGKVSRHQLQTVSRRGESS